MFVGALVSQQVRNTFAVRDLLPSTVYIKRIPCALPNLLVSEFEAAFTGSDSDFDAEYDFKKPTKSASSSIVLTASGGSDPRAGEATRILSALGYDNVAVYEGGLSDWKDRGGPVRQEQKAYNPTCVTSY